MVNAYKWLIGANLCNFISEHWQLSITINIGKIDITMRNLDQFFVTLITKLMTKIGGKFWKMSKYY